MVKRSRPSKNKTHPEGGRQTRGNELLGPLDPSQQQGYAVLGRSKHLLSLEAQPPHMSPEHVLPRVIQDEPRLAGIVAR